MFSAYEGESRIHEGVRHDVYRARHRVDGRPVVIKLLKQPFPSMDEIERFRVEYQALRRVRSPRVIEGLDFVEDRSRWLLVMEDIGGRALADLVNAGDVGLAERIEIAIALVEAVQAVHDAGVIHKDINPRNIVWNPSTGALKLIDFGIATPLSSESPAFSNRNLFEGTLDYLAPEQSGRVRERVDSRADLYAVGATLYELFTGRVPFDADDPLALVYAHLARRPVHPARLRPDLPAVLDGLVMRLLEKSPADRYQTAHGLLRDLQRCRDTLTDDGRIPDFELARFDRSDRFEIGGKLHGRDDLVTRLLEALSAACDPADKGEAGQLVVVKGGAGMGKTALIQELYRPLTRQRGIFVSGKHDQFSRLPLASVAGALDELVQQALSLDEAPLRALVDRLRDALGPNGGVLTELVPRLQTLIGAQAPAEALLPNEQKNRQARVCREFVEVFATPEIPVVIFLDDLQWADGATLDLVEALVRVRHPGLLVIAAFRDAEVDHAHPLNATLDRLVGAGVTLHELHLAPLTETHVVEMLVEATGERPAAVAPLARLALRNTGGNPLWVREYLQALAANGLVRFDRDTGAWTWRIEDIERRAMTTSVLELIVEKLGRMPSDCLQVLQVAACVGSRFDLDLVGHVLDRTPRQVFDALLPALNSGIVVASSALDALLADDISPARRCAFVHDRIQQAAAGMLDADRLAALHLQIGRYLLEHTQAEQRDEHIFEIVSHLDAAIGHISDPGERLELARLNLAAGRRASQASAFDTAARYLSVGLACLPADPWTDHGELSLALHRTHAVASMMSGDPARAEELSRTAAAHARDPMEQAAILAEQAYIYTNAGRYPDAVAAMARGLELVGYPFPPEDELEPAMARLHARLVERMGDLEPLDLLDRETMQDEAARAAMALLGAGVAPSFYLGPVPYSVVILMALNVCLEHGNPPSAFNLYACYGHLLSGVFGDRRRGHDFGRLAVALCDRHGNLKDKASSAFITANFAASWVQPIARQRALNEAGFQAGLESGDLVYAAYILCYIGHNAFHQGQALQHVDELTADHAAFHARIDNRIAADVTDALRLCVRNLRGETVDVGDFALPDLSEEDFRRRAEANHSAMALCYLDIFKAEALLRYGDADAALAALDAAAALLPTIMNNHAVARHAFLTGLALCRCSAALTPDDVDERLDGVEAQLESWAEGCPENFAHMGALVRAERARRLGADSAAIEAYDEAIRLSDAHDFPHDLALARELAGRFWSGQQRAERGLQLIARARYGYALWGAVRKVELLEAEFPQLVDLQLRPTHSWLSTQSGTGPVGMLDLASVIRASQALSGEIKLDRLLQRLMTIVLHNAGAQRGALLLDDGDDLAVQAIGHLEASDEEQELVVQIRPDASAAALPRRILSYVQRTGDAVIVADATEDHRFAGDPYVTRYRPHSVLCMPIRSQGQVIGLLYLENREIAGAFTDEQRDTLQLLASQFAISFENAELYHQMEAKVEERTAQLAAKNRELEATLDNLRTTQDRLVHAEKMASLGQLTAGVAHEINNPLNFVNNFSALGTGLIDELRELLDEGGDEARAEIDTVLGDLQDNLRAIQTHGARAADIVRSMLLHARDGDDQRAPANLNALVSKYVSLAEFGLRDSHRGSRVDVQLDLDDSLPMVPVSAQDLGRVMVNLLNNAHDAVATRGSSAGPDFQGRVIVSTRRLEAAAEIRIRDNGTGVPEELRDRIFEPFFTTKAGTAGTGLGLSLCYDIIVQGHGGELLLEEVDGEGASFVIRLPSTPT